MNAFGPWLLQQMKNRGLTQAALAEQVGVSQVQVSRWVNSADAPRTPNVFALAGYLNVSPRVILALLGIDASEEALRWPVDDARTINVPVLTTVSADPNQWWGDAVEIVRYAPDQFTEEPDRFVGALVTGDCLAPEVIDGDLVIVDLKGERRAGRLVAVLADGATHVKRLERRDKQWVLTSNDGDLRPVDEVRLLGVVVETRRRHN